VAQKFHFAILQIKVTSTSRGLSAIAELLVSHRTLISSFYFDFPVWKLSVHAATNLCPAIHGATVA